MAKIAEARQVANPNNVAKYLEAAKALGLNAVDQPFWEDFVGYEPDLVICPDILHGLLRFWRDHIFKWIRNLIGAEELDRRVKAVQPITGIRQFQYGISHLSQWTGREDRELQRIILAVIAGVTTIDGRAMGCLRAFHDFLYLAQFRRHSTNTLHLLERALKTFHDKKSVFIKNGARRGKKKKVIPHFNLPKMSGLHMYAYHIPRMGTSVQFSTEITETCHQTMAKAPYKATNHKEFFVQMCKYLMRKDTLSLTADLGAWYFAQPASSQQQTAEYHAFLCKTTELARKQERLKIRKNARAKDGYAWVSIKPDRRCAALMATVAEYCLFGFSKSLVEFLQQQKCGPVPPNINFDVDVWYQCRIQRATVQNDEELADSRRIKAVPHTVRKKRHGLYNCVLVKVDDMAGDVGLKGGFHPKSLEATNDVKQDIVLHKSVSSSS